MSALRGLNGTPLTTRVVRLLAVLAVCVLALLATGCANLTPVLEVEHISHPGAGWPVGPADEEAQLTQGNALVRYRKGGLYIDAGIGVKLYEKSQLDFVGPRVTGTVRVGYEFRRGAP